MKGARMVETPDVLSGIQVAIVEDDTLLRESLALFLRVKGCRVEAFGSAAEACAAGNFRRFDAVISDFLLPGENGISLLSRVREESEAAVMILITAYRGEELPGAARRAGVDAIIPKPFFAVELENELRTLLGRKGAEDDRFTGVNV